MVRCRCSRAHYIIMWDGIASAAAHMHTYFHMSICDEFIAGGIHELRQTFCTVPMWVILYVVMITVGEHETIKELNICHICVYVYVPLHMYVHRRRSYMYIFCSIAPSLEYYLFSYIIMCALWGANYKISCQLVSGKYKYFVLKRKCTWTQCYIYMYVRVNSLHY